MSLPPTEPPAAVGNFLRGDRAHLLSSADRAFGTLATPGYPSESPTGSPGRSMQHLKAFIVEDSPIILDNLAATLEELAPVKVVASAADEASAVHWLSDPANHADLVIIDIFLRTGSGLGVLRRAAQANVQGKRVVLTNYATADMREKCAALGADRVFDKSNELDELLTYCSRLAEGSGDTVASHLA
jgi:DNA-binding NarL/FixJ family response regulator